MAERPVRPLPARRLRSHAAPLPAIASAAPAQPRVGFHRQLQEATLKRALELRRDVKHQETKLSNARKKWNELLEARTSHTAVQQAALQSITSTIASSTALSTFSRQLSTDAVQISHDVRTLMNRYASHIVDLMAVKPLERRNEAVLALESTPNGLLATDLFKGLFDGVSFENVKNAAAEWEEMVREATPGSNSAQIAVSWHQIFETFESLVPTRTLSESAKQHLLDHRTAIAELMRPAAACQLTKMAEIDSRLAELSEAATRMRQENTANWRKHAEIQEGLEKVRHLLAELKVKLPVTRARYEDHLLQLVILARGA